MKSAQNSFLLKILVDVIVQCLYRCEYVHVGGMVHEKDCKMDNSKPFILPCI